MQKILFVLIVFLFIHPCTNAQKIICGFDYLQKNLRKDIKYLQSENKTNAQIQIKTAEIIRHRSLMNNLNILPGNIYEIPVVVHIIYKSGDAAPGSSSNPTDAKVQETIDRLNADFSGIGAGNIGATAPLRFTLAKRTPNCSSTNGINRIHGGTVAGYNANGLSYPSSGAPGADDSTILALSSWSPRMYLNIWVVWKITASEAGYIIGAYAALPLTNDGDIHVFPDDGIVMLGSEVRGNSTTLTHEVGHSMGLYHTFEGDDLNTNSCPSNADPLRQGDLVADTDPVKNLIFANPFPLNTDPNPCNNNNAYNGSQSNIMGYGIGPLNRFTPGQSTRMMAFFEAIRNSFANSQASLSPPLPSQIVKAANKIPGKNVYGTDFYVGPCDVKLADLHYNSYGVFYDGRKEYIDNSCNIGTHLSALKNYTLTVSTQETAQRCKAWIDFNNDGKFDSSEVVLNSIKREDINYNHIATISSDKLSSAFTLRNQLLRMRIMTDWSESPDFTAESSLEFGQTEDFWINISSPLAVVFNQLQAIFKSNNLNISWSTASETNNDHFIIEGSKDGTNFFTLTTVASKATEGNSSSLIQYDVHFNSNNGSLAWGFSIFLVAVFIFLTTPNNRKKLALATGICLLFILACNKKDTHLIKNSDEVSFIRITQVDKNGVKNSSKAVKIIKE